MVALLAVAQPAPAEPIPTVSIRVVDLAALGPGHVIDALEVTRALYSSVGISVTWRYCSDAIDNCSSRLSANEVWLRIAPGRAAEDGWAREWVAAGALGFSNLDAGPHTGVMSTVFADQIMRLASAAHVSSQTLLGQVAAHEVAHLVLGSAAHTHAGLMAARWSSVDPGPRRFSASFGGRLRAALIHRD